MSSGFYQRIKQRVPIPVQQSAGLNVILTVAWLQSELAHAMAPHGITPHQYNVLTDEAWLHAKGSYLQIMSTIIDGVPGEKTMLGVPMPPRGGSNLTDTKVQAVAAFVWYLSHRNDY